MAIAIGLDSFIIEKKDSFFIETRATTMDRARARASLGLDYFFCREARLVLYREPRAMIRDRAKDFREHAHPVRAGSLLYDRVDCTCCI